MQKGNKIHSFVQRHFRWLLPETSRFSEYDLSRLRILNSIHLLFLFFSIAFIFICTFIYPENSVPPLLPMAFILVMLFVFKRWGNFVLSGNLLSLLLFLSIFPAIGDTGGLYSDNLIWLILLPVVAFLLTNQQSGLTWLAVLMSSLIYFFVLETNAPVSYRELTLKYGPSYYFTSWALLFPVITLIVFLFSAGKNHLITSLFESKKTLLAQKEEIMQQTADLKENEQKLQKLNEKLEHFAYAISHDLKQPLRTIKMYTQILEKNLKDTLSETDQEYMTFVQDGTDKMHTLLVDLLEYSKLDTTQMKKMDIAVDDVILLVKNQLSATIKETNAFIEIANDLQTLHTNPSLLSMLFQNLINNAIKFRAEGKPPHIIISSEVDEDQNLTIHVQDNGVGIPKAYQKKVFDIFTKIHSTSKVEGSGIGLSTCLKIIEGINGKITLDSEVNVGTTFHLFFPKEVVILNEAVESERLLTASLTSR